MRTVPRSEWLRWMKSRFGRRKSIEVKEHNGNYYLYEYTNKWDKKNKKPVKTTKYVGVVKEKESWRALEHGHVSVLHALASKTILPKLKEHFPCEWKQLAAFSMNRVIQPMPLKRLDSWFEKTTLPQMLSLKQLTLKTVSNVLG